MKQLLPLIAAVLLCTGTIAEAVTPKQVERIEQLKKDAAAFIREGKYDQATPLLNEILAIDPADKTAVRYLALVKQQAMEPMCKDAADAFVNENYAKSIEVWDKLLKMNPDDRRFASLIDITKNLITDKTTNEMYQHAEKFVADGDYKSAVNELEKILAVRPYDSKARSLLISAKSNVVDVRTKKHYDQADAYMKEKQYDLAIGEWKKILDIDPSQEAASRFIASAVREKMGGLYAEAKEAYERGDYLTSRDYYNKIMADNPTDLDVKNILGKIDDVAKVTLKIDEKSPAADMMRKALAFYIAPDGNKKASMAGAWYAFQLNPNSLTIAVKGFLELKYVAILSTMEAPVGDMNIIDQYLFAALNHIYEGRYDLAIQECTIVIELQPGNILGWKRLGSGYYAIGKKDKAKETWERALKIAPDDAELKQFIKQVK
ncbi:MAG: tetratricopeptide repeat protein [Nitrospiraceae bacterium]|nr:tetratricopeptide repeat protein [Nitrospiraceae bacterium]